jgi:ElaB/YqjD/DUF883 family membrane-anchored ribosome-binding protein
LYQSVLCGYLLAIFSIRMGLLPWLFAKEFFMPKIRQDTLPGKDKLVADLQRVIADAEELMQATAHQTEGKVAELRERISDNLRDARHKLADAEDAIKEKTREVARATDDYVHEHPWSAIGAAAGLGLVVGLLISRR